MLFIIKKAPPHHRKRLTIVIGKEVVKGAVQRNLLKRRIRAIVQPVIGQVGDSFVIIVRPGAASLSYPELEKELKRALEVKR